MKEIFQNTIDKLARRDFLGQGGTGLGVAALAGLLGGSIQAGPAGLPGLKGLPHHAPKAKRVVYLWQGGAPTHVDLFDPKPLMEKMKMQELPESVRGKTRLSTMTAGYNKHPIVPAIKPFKKYGKSGMEITSMMPHIGSIADDITLIRSMNTEAVNHAPGVTYFLTGAQVPGRPSMGAWLTYGLGTESSELPAFVVMTSSDRGKTCGQLFFDYYWGSGFLPTRHQGVRFRGVGDPVPYLNNPEGVSPSSRAKLLAGIDELNRAHLAEFGDPEIDTRISQYEMAFRMQTRRTRCSDSVPTTSQPEGSTSMPTG